MKESLKEYSEAFEAHINALKDEMRIKEKVRSTYYRLMRARDELKATEKQLLDDNEQNRE